MTAKCLLCDNIFKYELYAPASNAKCPICKGRYFEFSGEVGGITFRNCIIDNRNMEEKP